MWIRKYQYERILERLDELEKFSRRAIPDPQYIVKEGTYYGFGYEPCGQKKVPIQQVVRALVTHLGLDLGWFYGTPEHMTVEARKEAAKSKAK